MKEKAVRSAKTGKFKPSRSKDDKKGPMPLKKGRGYSSQGGYTSQTRIKAKEKTAPYFISSRIRAIGNSKGVILNYRLMEEAGISPEADIIIQASDGMIIIAEAKAPGDVNTDLSTWGAQFKKAIKKGHQPESDLWAGVPNSFDEKEWT